MYRVIQEYSFKAAGNSFSHLIPPLYKDDCIVKEKRNYSFLHTIRIPRGHQE